MYVPTGPSKSILRAFAGAFHALAYAAAVPFLLIAVVGALLVVIIDFAVFRVHDMFLGHPQPKGLWEF